MDPCAGTSFGAWIQFKSVTAGHTCDRGRPIAKMRATLPEPPRISAFKKHNRVSLDCAVPVGVVGVY